jgi:TBC1 domain family protein 5
LKKIIVLDVNRTYQDKDLFQNTLIKETLVNILFIWSKENKDVSYKQGMNEILAVFLFGIYPFYFTSTRKPTQEELVGYTLSSSEREKYAKEIYLYFHDQDEMQSDLYFMFDAMMSRGIKDLFDTGCVKKKETSNFKKQDLFQQQWTEGDDELDKVTTIIRKNNIFRLYYLYKEDVT